MIGETVSHFLVKRKLGEGGMGVVYEAEDQRLKRRVALKFLHPHLLDHSDARARFLREAQAAAALNHPNIVTIYEVDEKKTRIYIAMEFVEGTTLDEKMGLLRVKIDAEKASRSHGLQSIGETIRIAIQICQGLQAAAERGVVHRDIKPQNIIVTPRNHVKILDFGMAKLTGIEGLTEKHFAVGTLHYMSPEQLNNEDVDHRSDIWALGVLLYQMITGRAPFEGDTPEAVISSILTRQQPSLSIYNTRSPPEMEWIVQKALIKNKNFRYQQSQHIQKDLESINPNISHSITARRPDTEVSIAVLPFTDMSPQKDQEYFCDGMTEEIINYLVKIPGLRVAPRTSCFKYKGQPVGLDKIASELQVQTLLEGSVRKAGNRLRITVKLYDMASQEHRWSEQYDRELKDIFTIQDEITTAIASNLKLRLLEEGERPRMRRYTQDPEAYKLYLQGKYFWNRRYEGGLKKSIEYFEKAIDIDPQYAQPYVGIADSLNILGLYGFISPEGAYPRTKKLASRALGIDPFLAEAHAALAWASTYYDWDWARAEEGYTRAIDLNPKYAMARIWYSLLLITMGKPSKAIQMANLALDIDPLSLNIISMLALIFIMARRFEDARHHLNHVLEMDSNFLLARIWMGETYLFTGDYPRAIKDFEHALTISPHMTYTLANLGCALSLSGDREGAMQQLEIFDAIGRTGYVSQLQKAYIYIGLEELDHAFSLIEKAFAERDSFLVWLRAAPHFTPLHRDPRYFEYLVKIGLEEPVTSPPRARKHNGGEDV
jgi:serine/threonine protein kinase/tetratricopeptide (TPR) repeat protein